MYKKGMLTVWIALVTLLISTSACNSSFFKPETPQITQNSVAVIPAQNNVNRALSATAFVGPPTEASFVKSSVSSTTAPVNKIPDFETPEVTNIWDRIQTGMQLKEHTDHERVKRHINRYSQHQDYIDRVTDRAEPFLYLIMEQIEAKNMPTEIALLPIVESAFQPFAYSHGRAAGIWQFIPGTGRMYGLKQNW
jgi:membrane-bound lytic murein transglycosylase D